MARVKIASGELEGRETDGVQLFAGIPYAAPPIGERRFLAPLPHPGWDGVRDAKRFGRAAPQRPGEGLTAAPLRWDEDCLTLNVATPAADDGARPVLDDVSDALDRVKGQALGAAQDLSGLHREVSF